MTFSNDKRDRGAINRLKSWLASDPEIPRFRRHANKAAICRQAGIARSTADVNLEIRALLVELDRKVLTAQHTAAKQAPEPKCNVPEVAAPPSPKHSRATSANLASSALEHLLQTGRVVR